MITIHPEKQALSAKLQQSLVSLIKHKGPLTFSEYMQHALYHPSWGYYRNHLLKFGQGGDFTTAPECSSLFSYCLAKQCQQILSHYNDSAIIEFGGGSGALAIGLLQELERVECLPKHYYIVEVSSILAQRQQSALAQALPHLLDRVIWLDTLDNIQVEGVIIANEVLDAMPVHKFHLAECLQEYYVTEKNGQLCWHLAELSSPELTQAIASLALTYQDYDSEINLLLPGWIKSISRCLSSGVALLIDYGFWRDEYYHPERSMGTLQCHFEHGVYHDPLRLPGCQDITAHVDFTAVAEAAEAAMFEVLAYRPQAGFLLACGVLEPLTLEHDTARYYALAQQVKTLTLPSEMGEMFKVMALGKNFTTELLGFIEA